METGKRRWTTSSGQGPIHSSLTFTVESGFTSGLYSSSVCLVRPGDTLHGSYHIKTGLAMVGSWVEVSLQGTACATSSGQSLTASDIGIQSVLAQGAVLSRDGMYREDFSAERVESTLALWTWQAPVVAFLTDTDPPSFSTSDTA